MKKLENIKTVTSLPPLLYDNAAFNGAAVEVAGYSSAVMVLAIGAIDIALTTLKLQESDDNSVWTDVTGGAITGADLPGALDDNKQWAFTYNGVGGMRYIRIATVVGNGTLGANMHAYCMLADGINLQSDAGRGFELNVNC